MIFLPRGPDPGIEHILDSGRRCWCRPHLLEVCPSCDDDWQDRPGCYRCKGRGTIEATENRGQPIIVVHCYDEQCNPTYHRAPK